MDKPQNHSELEELTPLELDESLDLDLTVPDLGSPSSPGLSDDDLLNVPTLDDLDSFPMDGGDTLHDDTDTLQPVGQMSASDNHPLDSEDDLALPPDLSSDTADLAEDESITLSDAELENILDNAGGELFDEVEPAAEVDAETDDALPELDLGDSSEFTAGASLEEAPPDEPFGLPDDLSSDEPVMADVHHDFDLSGTEPLEHEHEHGDDTMAAPALGDDLDDEGPVALSEDELGSILSDVEEGPPAPMEAHQDQVDLSSELADVHGDEPVDFDDLTEKEEEITLSDAELESVLLDMDAPIVDDDIDAMGAGPEVHAAAPDAGFGLDDEEEQITLSAEELGNIVSEAEEEPVVHEAAAVPSIMDAGEEDEVVALSDSELDRILEDVEAPEEHGADGAVMAAHAPHKEENVIVLDDYEDVALAGGAAAAAGIGAAAAAPARTEKLADSISATENVNKDEVRRMISYLDTLFDSLPDEAVREFSKSEYFNLYRKIMSDLGLS